VETMIFHLLVATMNLPTNPNLNPNLNPNPNPSLLQLNLRIHINNQNNLLYLHINNRNNLSLNQNLYLHQNNLYKLVPHSKLLRNLIDFHNLMMILQPMMIQKSKKENKELLKKSRNSKQPFKRV